MGGSWIGGGNQTLAAGRVAHYRTHSEHRSGNWTFPAGQSCLATRSPKGELVLLFMLPYDEKREDKEFARAVWLEDGYGLCGVEPGVLDPMKMNHLMVQKACDEATARVGREIRAEAERERRRQTEIEDDITRAAARHMAEDLDRAAAEEIRVAQGADGTWKTEEKGLGKIRNPESESLAPKAATATTRKKARPVSNSSPRGSENPTSTRRRSTPGRAKTRGAGSSGSARSSGRS